MELSRILGLSILLFSASLRADWEAQVIASSSTRSFPETKGRFYSSKDRVRLDTPYPMEMSIYAKCDSRHVYAAIPLFKIRLSANISRFRHLVPTCLGRSFDLCVKQYGLKKKSEEPCSSRTCEVYRTSKISEKEVRSVELWRWKGEKEPIIAKMIIEKSNGEKVTSLFEGIERKEREESFYLLPKGYKDAGSLEKFFDDLRGKSDDE